MTPTYRTAQHPPLLSRRWRRRAWSTSCRWRAFTPYPYASYCASRAAEWSLTNDLRVEMRAADTLVVDVHSTALAGVVAVLASLRFALSCDGSSVTEVVTFVLALSATVLAIVVVTQAYASGRFELADSRDGRYKFRAPRPTDGVVGRPTLPSWPFRCDCRESLLRAIVEREKLPNEPSTVLCPRRTYQSVMTGRCVDEDWPRRGAPWLSRFRA